MKDSIEPQAVPAPKFQRLCATLPKPLMDYLVAKASQDAGNTREPNVSATLALLIDDARKLEKNRLNVAIPQGGEGE